MVSCFPKRITFNQKNTNDKYLWLKLDLWTVFKFLHPVVGTATEKLCSGRRWVLHSPLTRWHDLPNRLILLNIQLFSPFKATLLELYTRSSYQFARFLQKKGKEKLQTSHCLFRKFSFASLKRHFLLSALGKIRTFTIELLHDWKDNCEINEEVLNHLWEYKRIVHVN